MRNQTGIWLDLRNAWIINLPAAPDSAMEVQHIVSGIEENAAIVQTRMDTQWGPHGGNNQHTIEERQHHEEKHFFNDILKHIPPTTEELVVFGPSEAKSGFEKLLSAQHKGPRLLGIEAADRMTEHQMEAWVRNYFGRPAPRKLPKYGQAHAE